MYTEESETRDENGELHSYNDEPAKVYWGNREWYVHGKLHRDGDLPAVISARGDKEWYKNGKLHRDNYGPAVRRKDGVCSWYKHGLHLVTY